MAYPDSMQGADMTYPLTKLWAITGTEEDTDLAAALDGEYPRVLIATADGTLIVRLLNNDADVTIPVTAGFTLVGVIKQIGGATDCEPVVGI